MKTETEVEIVQKIIENEFERMQKEKSSETGISRYYIYSQIKIWVDPIRLYNKVLTYCEGTDDGVKNINAGAKKLFKDAIRRLEAKKLFYLKNGLVYRYSPKKRGRPKKTYDELCIQEMERIVSEHGMRKGCSIINNKGICVDGKIVKIEISYPTLVKHVKNRIKIE